MNVGWRRRWCVGWSEEVKCRPSCNSGVGEKENRGGVWGGGEAEAVAKSKFQEPEEEVVVEGGMRTEEG